MRFATPFNSPSYFFNLAGQNAGLTNQQNPPGKPAVFDLNNQTPRPSAINTTGQSGAAAEFTEGLTNITPITGVPINTSATGQNIQPIQQNRSNNNMIYIGAGLAVLAILLLRKK